MKSALWKQKPKDKTKGQVKATQKVPWKDQPVTYELEVIFLKAMIERLVVIRFEHDKTREELSTAINEVFNVKWGKMHPAIQRGSVLGVLKVGETAINDMSIALSKVQTLIMARVNELNAKRLP